MTCPISLKLISCSRPLTRAEDQERNERRATAALVILILVLGAASAWVAAAMSPGPAPVAIAKNAPPRAAQPFEYFPARYANQAAPPEEHIEAF
jgi:hypothetical protein